VTELVPENYVAPLDLIAIFGRIAPLDVDLGCGNGDLICELARRRPERNFLGIDKLAGRVAKSCRKTSMLDNVRILNVENSYAVRYLLPESSVENFYLLFPDPWPKRRHHRRRILTRDFLDSIHRALETNGTIYLATDDLVYFQHMQRIASSTKKLECMMHSSFADDVDLPVTKFERRFREQGAPIYRLALRKVSPVR
jgi:tRNA (guanine-N7-)-methyltransferase